MSASRESRESEITFKNIWMMLPHLTIYLWSGMTEDAIALIDQIQGLLDMVKEQLKKEQHA